MDHRRNASVSALATTWGTLHSLLSLPFELSLRTYADDGSWWSFTPGSLLSSFFSVPIASSSSQLIFARWTSPTTITHALSIYKPSYTLDIIALVPDGRDGMWILGHSFVAFDFGCGLATDPLLNSDLFVARMSPTLTCLFSTFFTSAGWQSMEREAAPWGDGGVMFTAWNLNASTFARDKVRIEGVVQRTMFLAMDGSGVLQLGRTVGFTGGSQPTLLGSMVRECTPGGGESYVVFGYTAAALELTFGGLVGTVTTPAVYLVRFDQSLTAIAYVNLYISGPGPVITYSQLRSDGVGGYWLSLRILSPFTTTKAAGVGGPYKDEMHLHVLGDFTVREHLNFASTAEADFSIYATDSDGAGGLWIAGAVTSHLGGGTHMRGGIPVAVTKHPSQHIITHIAHDGVVDIATAFDSTSTSSTSSSSYFPEIHTLPSCAVAVYAYMSGDASSSVNDLSLTASSMNLLTLATNGACMRTTVPMVEGQHPSRARACGAGMPALAIQGLGTVTILRLRGRPTPSTGYFVVAHGTSVGTFLTRSITSYPDQLIVAIVSGGHVADFAVAYNIGRVITQDHVGGIVSDGSGGCWIAGSTNLAVTLGGGPLTPVSGSEDVYVNHFSSSLGVLKSAIYGTVAAEYVRGVADTSDGGVVVALTTTVATSGTMTLDGQMYTSPYGGQRQGLVVRFSGSTRLAVNVYSGTLQGAGSYTFYDVVSLCVPRGGGGYLTLVRTETSATVFSGTSVGAGQVALLQLSEALTLVRHSVFVPNMPLLRARLAVDSFGGSFICAQVEGVGWPASGSLPSVTEVILRADSLLSMSVFKYVEDDVPAGSVWVHDCVGDGSGGLWTVSTYDQAYRLTTSDAVGSVLVSGGGGTWTIHVSIVHYRTNGDPDGLLRPVEYDASGTNVLQAITTIGDGCTVVIGGRATGMSGWSAKDTASYGITSGGVLLTVEVHRCVPHSQRSSVGCGTFIPSFSLPIDVTGSVQRVVPDKDGVGGYWVLLSDMKSGNGYGIEVGLTVTMVVVVHYGPTHLILGSRSVSTNVYISALKQPPCLSPDGVGGVWLVLQSTVGVDLGGGVRYGVGASDAYAGHYDAAARHISSRSIGTIYADTCRSCASYAGGGVLIPLLTARAGIPVGVAATLRVDHLTYTSPGLNVGCGYLVALDGHSQAVGLRGFSGQSYLYLDEIGLVIDGIGNVRSYVVTGRASGDVDLGSVLGVMTFNANMIVLRFGLEPPFTPDKVVLRSGATNRMGAVASDGVGGVWLCETLQTGPVTTVGSGFSAVGPSSSALFEMYTHFDHELKVVALKHLETTSGDGYVRSCSGDGRGGVYAAGQYSGNHVRGGISVTMPPGWNILPWLMHLSPNGDIDYSQAGSPSPSPPGTSVSLFSDVAVLRDCSVLIGVHRSGAWPVAITDFGVSIDGGSKLLLRMDGVPTEVCSSNVPPRSHVAPRLTPVRSVNVRPGVLCISRWSYRGVWMLVYGEGTKFAQRTVSSYGPHQMTIVLLNAVYNGVSAHSWDGVVPANLFVNVLPIVSTGYGSVWVSGTLTTPINFGSGTVNIGSASCAYAVAFDSVPSVVGWPWVTTSAFTPTSMSVSVVTSDLLFVLTTTTSTYSLRTGECEQVTGDATMNTDSVIALVKYQGIGSTCRVLSGLGSGHVRGGGAAYDLVGDSFRVVVQSDAGVALSLSDGVGTLPSGASTVRVLDVSVTSSWTLYFRASVTVGTSATPLNRIIQVSDNLGGWWLGCDIVGDIVIGATPLTASIPSDAYIHLSGEGDVLGTAVFAHGSVSGLVDDGLGGVVAVGGYSAAHTRDTITLPFSGTYTMYPFGVWLGGRGEVLDVFEAERMGGSYWLQTPPAAGLFGGVTYNPHRCELIFGTWLTGSAQVDFGERLYGGGLVPHQPVLSVRPPTACVSTRPSDVHVSVPFGVALLA